MPRFDSDEGAVDNYAVLEPIKEEPVLENIRQSTILVIEEEQELLMKYSGKERQSNGLLNTMHTVVTGSGGSLRTIHKPNEAPR